MCHICNFYFYINIGIMSVRPSVRP